MQVGADHIGREVLCQGSFGRVEGKGATSMADIKQDTALSGFPNRGQDPVSIAEDVVTLVVIAVRDHVARSQRAQDLRQIDAWTQVRHDRCVRRFRRFHSQVQRGDAIVTELKTTHADLHAHAGLGPGFDDPRSSVRAGVADVFQFTQRTEGEADAGDVNEGKGLRSGGGDHVFFEPPEVGPSRRSCVHDGRDARGQTERVEPDSPGG